MVNKKLSPEQEEEIYLMYLSGETMTKISSLYPVVISTVQRTIERKSSEDDTRKNIIFPKISKSLAHAEKPLQIALKLARENKEVFHKRQYEILMEKINNNRKDLDAIENYFLKFQESNM
jgi:hypothetical protein